MELRCALCRKVAITVLDGDACCIKCLEIKMEGRRIMGENIKIDVVDHHGEAVE